MSKLVTSIEKRGGSKLRSLVKIVEEPGIAPVERVLKMMMGKKQIGFATLYPHKSSFRIAHMGIEDPRLRGLGLGKKFYGEIMRRTPGKVLYSGSLVSPDAMRVWKRMKARGYRVSRPSVMYPKTTPLGFRRSVGGGPIFKARLSHGKT